MTLVLELEYLLEVSFAAVGPDSELPDWPPQPDRIFSALVAAWASRGQNRHETEAIEWLEVLPPPRILASEAAPRTVPKVFVPPNDSRSDKKKNARGVFPPLRSRQPRRFPATRPHDPVVRLFWDGVVMTDDILAALQRLAGDTAYVGHSASLTRCRFLRADESTRSDETRYAERRIYEGRFAELRRSFDAGRRPPLGALMSRQAEVKVPSSNVFGDRWLLLEHVGGDMPDLRACALVAKTIRQAVLSGYQRIGLEDRIPEVVSGHAADGSPAHAPHLAIVPLAFTGYPHADGRVMGFALIPPRGDAILDDKDFRDALRKLAPIDEERGRRILTIRRKEGAPRDRTFSVDLSPIFEAPADKRSLDPSFYVRAARSFATVTPIALDRHLKEKGDARGEEIMAQIASACRNIGLPEPNVILPDKHSAVDGAPSAYPSGKSPVWMRWRLPQSIASRQLTHAVIRFAAPVEGPVILGAGRFVGFGLCRPLDRERR